MTIEATKRNAARRQAKHALRYPQKSKLSAAQRRHIGEQWKMTAAIRAEKGMIAS